MTRGPGLSSRRGPHGFEREQVGTEQEALSEHQTSGSRGWGSWQWGQGSGSSQQVGPRFKSQLSSFLALWLWASRLWGSVPQSFLLDSGYNNFPHLVELRAVGMLSLAPRLSPPHTRTFWLSIHLQDPRAQRVKVRRFRAQAHWSLCQIFLLWT